MSLASDILGFWSLTSREDVDAAGQRHIDPILGPDPVGVLCFAPGRFAAQFSRRDRTATSSLEADAVSRPNNSAAVNGYDAYFGTYSVSEHDGLLAVTLDAALSPAGVGQSYTRRIRTEGDRLIIQLETTALDGTHVSRTLRFSRVGQAQ